MNIVGKIIINNVQKGRTSKKSLQKIVCFSDREYKVKSVKTAHFQLKIFRRTIQFVSKTVRFSLFWPSSFWLKDPPISDRWAPCFLISGPFILVLRNQTVHFESFRPSSDHTWPQLGSLVLLYVKVVDVSSTVLRFYYKISISPVTTKWKWLRFSFDWSLRIHFLKIIFRSIILI